VMTIAKPCYHVHHHRQPRTYHCFARISSALKAASLSCQLLQVRKHLILSARPSFINKFLSYTLTHDISTRLFANKEEEQTREYRQRQTLQATNSRAHNSKISDEQSQQQSIVTQKHYFIQTSSLTTYP